MLVCPMLLLFLKKNGSVPPFNKDKVCRFNIDLLLYINEKKKEENMEKKLVVVSQFCFQL